MMASTSEAGMKVEAAAEEGGLGRGRAVAAVDQLYGLKKQRRERPLGCTTAKERISRMPPCVAGKRSSIYRGVTRHRWTGRYEAHLWDKSTWNQNQNKKGKQVYLGAYDDEEAAARAYDLAALKYWGAGTLINFPVSDYARDLEEMQMISKEEYLVSLRRKSSAFSRGLPKCRGVSSGRLEASLGHMLGSDYCNSLSTASDPSMEKKYGNNICMDRKIDLTSHIRWWGPKRTHQPDSISKALDEKHGESEDINRELRAFECQKQPTVPFQLPSLGVPHDTKAQTSAVSACTILSRSAAFKNFLQKLSESHDGVCNTKETGYEKAVPMLSTGGIQRAGVSLSFSDLPLQRTQYPSGGILTVPSKTNWDPVDPVPDALFWTSLVPPAGLSVTSTVSFFFYSFNFYLRVIDFIVPSTFIDFNFSPQLKNHTFWCP